MIDLETLVRYPRWTERNVFPASVHLGDRVFACGEGVYLMINPNRGRGDPVRAVGWAESDYWASRAFSVPPFRGDLVAAASPQWRPPPSLAFTCRPEPLAFEAVCSFERSREGASSAIFLNANYRLTDCGFISCRVDGVDGVSCIYASHDPEAGDEPVAIEIRLPAK